MRESAFRAVLDAVFKYFIIASAVLFQIKRTVAEKTVNLF